MVDDKSIKGVVSSPLGISQPASTRPEPKDDNAAVEQQEFLTLLVHQLQHQDPLNPMKNEEFAVQLAQFSSLEQLIQINKKLSDSSSGGGELSSMASFLGHEVVLKDQVVTVAGGKGPNVLLNMPAGAQSGRIDLVGQNGQVMKSYTLEDLEPGRKVIALDGADVETGDYEVRAMIVNAQGQFETLESKITGTVEGFVMDPEPALVVNGRQVSLEEISEVYLGTSSNS